MTRCAGIRCTWIVASVMMPSRPSLPSTIWRTSGPVEAAGTGRVTSTPAGVTTRTARVRSAMSPYLSDCIPDERVAIQPPRVECAKLSGKWPAVQPRAPSCSSRSGPNTPACTRASPDASSISSTRLIRSMSTDTHRAAVVLRRLEAAGDVRPAAERDQHAVEPQRRADEGLDLGARCPGRTTASGTRPTSPLRWRTRSRRHFPRAWTTRSSGSVDTSPTAASSSARRSSGRFGSATSTSSNATSVAPWDARCRRRAACV